MADTARLLCVVRADSGTINNGTDWVLTDHGWKRFHPMATIKAVATANVLLPTPQVIDGIRLEPRDWFLLPHQDDPAENGVYRVAEDGTAHRVAVGYGT